MAEADEIMQGLTHPRGRRSMSASMFLAGAGEVRDWGYEGFLCVGAWNAFTPDQLDELGDEESLKVGSPDKQL